MNLRAGLDSIMPVSLRTHAGCGVRPRAVSNHGAVSAVAVHSGKGNPVTGHTVFGEVKASGLVRKLVNRKLPLVEHLLPSETQDLEKMFSKQVSWAPPVAP